MYLRKEDDTMTMIKVVKRDGRIKEFDKNRISNAVKQAAKDVRNIENPQFLIDLDNFTGIIEDIIQEYSASEGCNKIGIEEIQDLVINELNEYGWEDVSESYKEYRNKRTVERDKNSKLMNTIHQFGVVTDRDNANVGNGFSAKLLRIASESSKWHVLAKMMPEEMAKRHIEGDLYYHDLDSYNLTVNCLHIPTAKILDQGFNTGYGHTGKPKRIESAAELTCIILQSSQNSMFGGQSHPDFDNALAEYVSYTRDEITREYSLLLGTSDVSDEHFKLAIENKLKERVRQAMQAVVYNLNTMHARAGAQVPFSSLNLGLPDSEEAALVCECFLLEFEKGLGGSRPIFPNVIFRTKEGVNREVGDPYYYLYKLACRVAAKNMNPTFMNIDADYNKKYYDMGCKPATMGCRTYLMEDINGKPGVEGRGNNAPTTINLVRLGIEAKKLKEEKDLSDIDTYYEFMKMFDERIEQAKENLLQRYSVQCKLKVSDLPFIADQHLMVGSEGLKPNDSIEPIIKHGTFGIGFIGLAETMTAIFGKHHGESEFVRTYALKTIEHLREKCDEYKEQYKLNFSCYATPAEGLSSKFTDIDKNKYGTIPGVTDKDYYTNSFHVPVGFPIGIAEKLKIEAPYHKLCNGGHISYVEIDDYPSADQIEEIVSWTFKNTNLGYMGINFHIRFCKNCGKALKGEEECPRCGSRDIQGISRVTGYLSLDERFGKGKSAERADRTSHNNSDHVNIYRHYDNK